MRARTQVRAEGMGHPWVLLVDVLVWGRPQACFSSLVNCSGPPLHTWTSHSIRRTKSELERRTLSKCFCWVNERRIVLGVFSRASVTKPHKLGSLNNSKVLLDSIGGLKYKMPVCFPDPWVACLPLMNSRGLCSVCATSKNLCLWKTKKTQTKKNPETESHLCHPGLQFTLEPRLLLDFCPLPSSPKCWGYRSVQCWKSKLGLPSSQTGTPATELLVQHHRR